ncbi:MAG: ferritin [Phycisphaerae bacterium]
MMISEPMNAKLNEQITNEMTASQAYLAKACQFDGMGLKVLAKLFRKQTEEERMHALKILGYVLEVGGTVTLQAIPKPQAEFPTVVASVEDALQHELKVTQQIHDLVGLAEKERDYSTRSFLQWYVDEQVEEVSSMTQLATVARLAGNDLLKLELYLTQTGAAEGGKETAEAED